MTENDLIQELEQDPFVPFRIHLVSGKTVDVVRQDAAWPLTNRLLIFRNPAPAARTAEGYDVIAYYNIERIEQSSIGKRPTGKRKPA